MKQCHFSSCLMHEPHILIWLRHLGEICVVVELKGTMTWRIWILKGSPGCCTCSAKPLQPLTQARMEGSLFLAVLLRTVSRLW